MAEGRQELETRAKWCRRLARDCIDEKLRDSLQDMAVELERRALDGPGQT